MLKRIATGAPEEEEEEVKRGEGKESEEGAYAL